MPSAAAQITSYRLTLSEADFQRRIVDLARLCGWRIAHFRPGMTRRGHWATQMQGDPGWPDLVLVRRGQLLFAELKAEGGRLSEQQKLWHYALALAGARIELWRPSDWDTIVEALR